MLGPRSSVDVNETGMTIFPYEVRVGFGLSITSSRISQPAPTSSVDIKLDRLLVLTLQHLHYLASDNGEFELPCSGNMTIAASVNAFLHLVYILVLRAFPQVHSLVSSLGLGLIQPV